MFSDTKRIPFFYNDCLFARINIKKLLKHLKGLRIANKFHIWIALHQLHDTAAMVWFHMLNDQIINRP